MYQWGVQYMHAGYMGGSVLAYGVTKFGCGCVCVGPRLVVHV